MERPWCVEKGCPETDQVKAQPQRLRTGVHGHADARRGRSGVLPPRGLPLLWDSHRPGGASLCSRDSKGHEDPSARTAPAGGVGALLSPSAHAASGVWPQGHLCGNQQPWDLSAPLLHRVTHSPTGTRLRPWGRTTQPCPIPAHTAQGSWRTAAGTGMEQRVRSSEVVLFSLDSVLDLMYVIRRNP